MELNEAEKRAARQALLVNMQAQQQAEQAAREAQRRANHVEAVINTIVELRGLDPAKWRLGYDLNRDFFELQEVLQAEPEPVSEQTPEGEIMKATSNGDGPSDIKAALGLHAEESKLEGPEA